MRAVDILVTCQPEYVNNTWMMPNVHHLHFDLTNGMLTNANLTFPVTALTNTSWINQQLRPIKREEIILQQFSVFSAESNGKENFSLTCLETGDFLLDGTDVQCPMGATILLPEINWEIKNKHG